MLALRELQTRLFDAIAARAGDSVASDDTALVGLIVPRPPLAPTARIDVYGRMYWTRIVDALAESFPRTEAVVGWRGFETLGRAYLAAFPSHHPSLRQMGGGFGAFLATRTEGERPPYVPDLARLEWARLEVFDAADPMPLTLDDLRALPVDAWAELRLHLISALTCLDSAWPVHEIWAASEPAPADWAPRPTRLRVWRQDFLVYQASMDATEAAALAPLTRGTTFAAVCEALEGTVAADATAEEAARLLARWVEDGILEGGIDKGGIDKRGIEKGGS